MTAAGNIVTFIIIRHKNGFLHIAFTDALC